MKVSNSSAPEPQAAIFPIVLMNGLFSAIGVGIGSPKDQDKAMFNKCGSLCEPGTDRVARRPPSTDTEAGRSHSGVLLCGAFPRDVIARWGQLLSSRGIDVAGVAYMVNYDVPKEAEDFVHRMGRTCWAASNGVVSTFAAPDEAHALKKIERALAIHTRKYRVSPDSASVIKRVP